MRYLLDVVSLLVSRATMAQQHNPVRLLPNRRPVDTRHHAALIFQRESSLEDCCTDVLTVVPGHKPTLTRERWLSSRYVTAHQFRREAAWSDQQRPTIVTIALVLVIALAPEQVRYWRCQARALTKPRPDDRALKTSEAHEHLVFMGLASDL